MNTTVKRTIFGVLFLVVMIGGFIFNGYLYGILLLFMVVGMMHEFYAMTLGSKHRLPRVLSVLLAVGLFCGMYSVCAFGLAYKYVALNAILLLGIMISTMFEEDKMDFRSTAYLYTGLLYIAIPLSLSNLIVFRTGSFDGLIMLAFFVIIWSSDVGAYCLGMLLGQKIWPAKMCPSISPKKSWAGFVGGLLLAVVGAVVLYYTKLFTFPLVHCIVLSIIMHVAGVCGDLYESQWKRSFDVKDSGHIIPGHGGLMDRFDSALFAIPTGVLYLVINGLM